MGDLADRECVACQGNSPRLVSAELLALSQGLNPDWLIVDERHLERQYRFDTFRDALAFVLSVGELAEQQQHHPAILLDWTKVRLTVRTQKVQGLTESDFVFAAKADALLRSRK